MTYLLAGIIVIWLCGLLFVVGGHLNDVRLAPNNLAPDAQPSEMQPPQPQRLLCATASTLPFVPSCLGLAFVAAIPLLGRFFNLDQAQAYCHAHVDPALLNETGRNHLKRVSRHQFFFLAWAIAGLTFVVWISSSGNP